VHTVILRCVVLIDNARNEFGNKVAEQSRQIEREFRTKVKPVLNRAQVLTAADGSISLFLHEY